MLFEMNRGKHMRNKKGFTLIEMLAVIAIIAVLVAIIVPAIGSSTAKAKAAADAANLRSVLSILNIHVVNGEKTVAEIVDSASNPTSTMDPTAKLTVVFETPGFIDAFYANGDVYYSLEYLSEMATNGPDSEKLTQIGTACPNVPGDWYQIGIGAFTPNPG